MASSGEDVCGGAEGRPRNGAASSRDSPPRRQSLAAVLAAAQDATERKLILAGASLRRIVRLLRQLHYHLSWELRRGGSSRASDEDDDDDDDDNDDDDDDNGDAGEPEVGRVYDEMDVGRDRDDIDVNDNGGWVHVLLRDSFYRKVFTPRTLLPYLLERISPRQLALLAEDGLAAMVRHVRFDSEDSDSEDEEDGGGAARPL